MSRKSYHTSTVLLTVVQVKPNVGHSEGASGITAIIKSALALEKRTIPPNIHLKNPNPSSAYIVNTGHVLTAMANSLHEVPFQEAGLKVPLEPVPWPDSRCERVSVNSFGIGGTNAHVSDMLKINRIC